MTTGAVINLTPMSLTSLVQLELQLASILANFQKNQGLGARGKIKTLKSRILGHCLESFDRSSLKVNARRFIANSNQRPRLFLNAKQMALRTPLDNSANGAVKI